VEYTLFGIRIIPSIPAGTRPPPPPGTCRVSCSGTYLTHKWAIVFWLKITSAGSPNQANFDTLISGISSAWGTALITSLTNSTIMNLVQGVWIPTAGVELMSSNSTARTGSGGTSEMSDSAACYVISHHIGAYYRGGHPRTYLPGIPATSVTNGSTISGAGAAAIAGTWGSFATAIKALTAGDITAVDVGTVRFSSHNAWLVPPVFYPWQSHTCRTTLGTQRRRLTE